MSLSAVVMAHPSRRRFVDELLARLDRSVEVVWDRHGDRWETGSRAMLAHDPAATHHLVIQDDAVPCRNLIAGAERAVAVAGDRPVSFYTGRVRPKQRIVTPLVKVARRRGSSWFEHDGPWWGVAIAVPVAHIREMTEWCNGYPVANYDMRIWHYYQRQKIKCWYSVPSLVDHRPVSENPSLVRGRTSNRQAHWFIGADRSALEIEWTSNPTKRVRCN